MGADSLPRALYMYSFFFCDDVQLQDSLRWCAFSRVPIGNLESDRSVQAMDLTFSRTLRNENFLVGSPVMYFFDTYYTSTSTLSILHAYCGALPEKSCMCPSWQLWCSDSMRPDLGGMEDDDALLSSSDLLSEGFEQS